MTDEQKARLDAADDKRLAARQALATAESEYNELRDEIARSVATFAVGEIVEMTAAPHGRWQIVGIGARPFSVADPEYTMRIIRKDGSVGTRETRRRAETWHGEPNFVRVTTKEATA